MGIKGEAPVIPANAKMFAERDEEVRADRAAGAGYKALMVKYRLNIQTLKKILDDVKREPPQDNPPHDPNKFNLWATR
jgi:hypothetical protein